MILGNCLKVVSILIPVVKRRRLENSQEETDLQDTWDNIIKVEDIETPPEDWIVDINKTYSPPKAKIMLIFNLIVFASQ